MGRAIWKFPLAGVENTISVPRGGIVRAVASPGYGNSEPTIWIEVTPGVENEERTFLLFATGQTFDPPGPFVGTVFEGPYVWHIFEKKNG